MEQTAPMKVSSRSASIELGPAKSIAGGVTGTVVTFLGALGTAYSDGAVTGQEWINIALATVIGAAAAFGITWATPTSVTLK